MPDPRPLSGPGRGAPPAGASGEWESLDADWRALVEHSERYAELGFGPHAAKLRQGGPPPRSLRHAPLIIETPAAGDGIGDPAVAVALAAAALRVPALALVVTGGDQSRGWEGGQERDAQGSAAREFLDLLGRHQVGVVAGAPSGRVRVAAVCEAAGGPVRWLSLGQAASLRALLRERGDLAGRLAVTQLGEAGAPPPAGRFLLLTSAVAAGADLEVSAASRLYRDLAAGPPAARPWARLLATSFERWFAVVSPVSVQRAALALSVALERPFVRFALDRAAGAAVFRSRGADHAACMRWLAAQLGR